MYKWVHCQYVHVFLEIKLCSDSSRPKTNKCLKQWQERTSQHGLCIGLTGAQRLCNTGEPQIRAKQLSMAATARVIWLCASVRYWRRRKLVSGCLLLLCSGKTLQGQSVVSCQSGQNSRFSLNGQLCKTDT